MRSIADIFRSHAQFDSQGRHTNGTDKQSNHSYGEAYERIIERNFTRGVVSARNYVLRMMEIGVADGACLLAWREVFPNAAIVGMDIHPSEKAHGDRIEFHIGDQRSKKDCENATKGRLFDLIIEDATHRLDDSFRTLLYLWPYVAPGGIYIIEEFDNIGELRLNIAQLWPFVEIVDTTGPFGGNEPLVVFKKPGAF